MGRLLRARIKQSGRSGAFALVILDLVGCGAGREAQSFPTPLLARLLGLARRHHSAVLFMTAADSKGSRLGSLISLRAEARIEKGEQGLVRLLEVSKDRRQGPGWQVASPCLGPAGVG